MPKIKPKPKTKTTRIELRCTLEEKELIIKNAKKHTKSGKVSEYLLKLGTKKRK